MPRGLAFAGKRIVETVFMKDLIYMNENAATLVIAAQLIVGLLCLAVGYLLGKATK